MAGYNLPYGVYVLRPVDSCYRPSTAGACCEETPKDGRPETIVVVTKDTVRMFGVCPRCGKRESFVDAIAVDQRHLSAMAHKMADTLEKAVAPAPTTETF